MLIDTFQHVIEMTLKYVLMSHCTKLPFGKDCLLTTGDKYKKVEVRISVEKFYGPMLSRKAFATNSLKCRYPVRRPSQYDVLLIMNATKVTSCRLLQHE